MKATIAITGVTGFLGAYLAIDLLEGEPDLRLLLLGRSKGRELFRERAIDSLRDALKAAGKPESLDAYLPRLSFAELDLTSGSASEIDELSALMRTEYVTEFLHCAAAVLFRDNGDRIWNTNVKGLEIALRLAADAKVSGFNFVSTAYSAGVLVGRISESLHRNTPGFNNLYEESKNFGELLVSDWSRCHAIPSRIFRPSIIVGDSRTHAGSTDVGFYTVVTLLRAFTAELERRDPGYFSRNALRLPVDPCATLNMIPVDIVSKEITGLVRLGSPTWDKIFHITNENPFGVADLFRFALPLLGISRVVIGGEPSNVVDQLFASRLKLFHGYFNGRKTFDRSNVQRHRQDHHQLGYLFDIGAAIRMAFSHLAQEPAKPKHHSDIAGLASEHGPNLESVA
jgi:nucleoside-diphosphate-sugar epimerase